MTGFLKKTVLGGTLAATVLSVAAPAEAQRWRGRDRNRGGDVAAGALVGGIVGLGLGAAIASSNRDRYYDRGHYDDRGYYYGPGPRGYYYDRYQRGYYQDRYYAPPPRAYHGDGYYRRPYRGYYGY